MKCPKLNDPTLKATTDKIHAEKIMKCFVVHNADMGICLSE